MEAIFSKFMDVVENNTKKRQVPRHESPIKGRWGLFFFDMDSKGTPGQNAEKFLNEVATDRIEVPDRNSKSNGGAVSMMGRIQ